MTKQEVLNELNRLYYELNNSTYTTYNEGKMDGIDLAIQLVEKINE